MKRILHARTLSFLLLCLALSALAQAEYKQGVIQRDGYSARAEVQAFITALVERHNFDETELTALFDNVERQTKVLDAIARPAEAKPWYQYRPIFLTPQRIAEGVRFWEQNHETLAKAEQAFDVPAQIIVAIIGVESFYGRHMGGFPVLDTLITLGFDYPPRARFFRSELEQLLLLAREESLDTRAIQGSYAGAMGKGQFISSSYRSYAVDFDDDGKRDLWDSNADAIGSVANYFKRHGWRLKAQVTLPARVTGTGYRKLLKQGLKPNITLGNLRDNGVRADGGKIDEDKVALIELDVENGKQYWIGFNNFYVITRYNRSPLYAMAVYQLSQQIRQAREDRLANAQH